jgi:(p)ppGpp synthase/HD superfamily hydrolase
MTFLTNRFTEALKFATELHADQLRKNSGIPYISHLLGAASIALEYGANEDEAIAALLHDAIEDKGGMETGEEIRRLFGDNVLEIVLGCSDSHTIPKPPWQERKEAYIKHIVTASASIRLVSAADKIHNARSIVRDYRAVGDAIWNIFQGKREGTIWYYKSLVTAFQAAEQTPKTASIAVELVKIVEELETLGQL